MNRSRPAAVAGMFYPDRQDELAHLVSMQLGEFPQQARLPIALIAPHAGLVYSGTTAARAYRTLHPNRSRIRRVAMFGPSHRVPLTGLAVPDVEGFATPLGEVPLDQVALHDLAQLPQVNVFDEAHRFEHSLEVQLPFLQSVLEQFQLVPVVVGWSEPESVAQAMARVMDGETLLVVSSDLSHFHTYDEARTIDAETAAKILTLDEDLNGDQACGCHAINGLMHLAAQRGWSVDLVSQCNSGDTAGSRDRVVGYGAFALHETV